MDGLGDAEWVGSAGAPAFAMDGTGDAAWVGSGGTANYALLSSTIAAGPGTGPITSPMDTTGAALIVVAAVYYNLGATPTLTDSAGNTWNATLSWLNGTTQGRIQLFYTTSPITSSSHTFSLLGAGSFGTIIPMAFSKGTVSLFFSDTGGGVTQPGSQTGTTFNNLYITSICDNVNGDISNAINQGFTIIHSAPFATGSNFGLATAILISNSAGPFNPTWSGGSGQSVCSLSVFDH
jgi:hypothetical protein